MVPADLSLAFTRLGAISLSHIAGVLHPKIWKPKYMFYNSLDPRRWYIQALAAWCFAWVALPIQLLQMQMPSALANPGGGTVVGGSATIVSGPGQVTVNQTSNRAVVNWGSFSINKGETTTFVQPGSKSAMMNRVTGGTVSRIDGNLNANGQVYLVNRNGVVIGKTGRVNTAGFTASTHDVANSEFMTGGDLTYRGSSGASVINQGKIRATDGDVTLIARQVENTGKITARKGSVNLAGGTEVLLKPSGDTSGQRVFIRSTSGSGTVSNSGSIRAAAAELHAAGGNEYALAINNTGVIRATGSRTEGGRVLLTTSKGGRVVNGEGGTIRAVNNDGSGGEVRIAGGQIELKRNSTINVSARKSTGGRGGTILVGGEARGAGTMEQAQSVTVDAGALLQADAAPAPASSPYSATSFDGGKVVVWSTGTTTFNGSISALGSESASGNGTGKGKGGWVETSGHDLSISRDAMVITGGGEWLLDPVNLTIVSTGGASGSVSAANAVTGADTSINSSAIVSALASGDVTLLATNSITLNGNASFTFSTGFDLTLDTPTINLLGSITSTGGSELKGTATTVNVGAGGRVQNAVDVASATASATINLAAATYRENVTIASKNLTISGAGRTLTTVSGDIDTNGTGDGRVFDITGTGKTVTIANMTITQGATPSIEGGGGIRINTSGNTVTIRNSNVTDNAAGSLGGGGIYNRGTLLIDNSSVSSNRAGATVPVAGGGIAHLDGTLTITGSQINDNSVTTASAAVGGGGLYSTAGTTVNASNSEFLRNELSASANGFGGGIYAQLTFLTLNNVLVNDNSIAVNTGFSSARGGGIYIDRSIVSIDRTTVSGNTLNGAFTVMGGGICLENTIGSQSFLLTNSTISGNSATVTGMVSAYGGGLYITNSVGSVANITSSTINDNYVSSIHTSLGGGIYVNGNTSTLTLTNVTMTGNEARTSPVAARGGAIQNAGTLTILDSTIVNNGALAIGGGVSSLNVVTIRNSIVARNYQIGTPGWMDVAGAFNDLGNNLIGDAGTATGFTTSTLVGNAGSPIDPLLAPLGSYGGPTQTMALLNGSPALNAGSSASVTDQRGAGYVRTAGSTDIGAYEAQTPGTSPFNASYVVTNTQDYSPTMAAISNSLRMALTFAEAPDTILFNIPTGDPGHSGGVYTIRAAAGTTGFATSGRFRIIDGTSQTGYASAPLIVLDGMDLGSVLSLNPGAGRTVQLKALAITNGTAVNGGGLNIASGSVTMTDSLIYSNTASAGPTAKGGGIYNRGTLILDNTSVYLNEALSSTINAFGGGIYNQGILTIRNGSVVRDNKAQATTGYSSGGGIINDGSTYTVTITDSTISNNRTITGTTNATGGGIYNWQGTIDLTNTLISGNSTYVTGTFGTGGGIYSMAGTLNVTNTTIADNSATATGTASFGGGIYVEGGAAVTIKFSTITDNTVQAASNALGGGIYRNGSNISVQNTIIAGNYNSGTLARTDVSGSFVDNGYNLIGDSTGSTGFITSTLVGTGGAPIDPLLAPLGNYGGPTQTYALLPGSPALNAANPTAPIPAKTGDLRGAAKYGGRWDIGAFESQGFVYSINPATGGDNQTAVLGTAFAPLTVTIASNDGITNFTGGKVTIAVPTTPGAATATGTLTQTILSGTPTQAIFNLTAAVATGTYHADVTDSTTPLFFTLTNSGIPISLLADAGQGKVYGDADTLPFGYSILTGPIVVLNGVLSRQAGEDSGSYAFLLGTLITLNPNYSITLAAGPDFTITPRAITVTANAQSKTYGDADPALTWVLTSGNLANGDTTSIFTGSQTRTGTENVGIYGINRGTLAASANYLLTYQGNIFSITPRAITLIPDGGQSKVYGNTDPELTFSIVGTLAPWDTSPGFLNGRLSRLPGEQVGAYSFTLGTLDNSNYLITASLAGIYFDILPPSASEPSTPGQPGLPGLPSLDPGTLATFNATLGRNNEDEQEYPRLLRKAGSHPHISYGQPNPSSTSLLHLSSFDILSDGTPITQPR